MSKLRTVTKPENMRTKPTPEMVNDIVQIFEEKFKEEDKDQQYYHLVIRGEYPRSLLDEIEQIYLINGWSKVVCQTSSENGERPGLTGLQLWV